MWALYLGYGLYYGAFQGAASALVADLVPADLRGTAYGLFSPNTMSMKVPLRFYRGLGTSALFTVSMILLRPPAVA